MNAKQKSGFIDLGRAAYRTEIRRVNRVEPLRQNVTIRWEPQEELARRAADADEDPFALRLPTVLLANKADLLGAVDTELRAFLELTDLHYPAVVASALTGEGLGDIGPLLFRQPGIVRVYTKVPGQPPRRDRPFTMRRGQTVDDIARLVHKDLARSLKYARVWGKSGFEGQHVGREHRLADGDVVELHT
jgi:ribosome-interacting GTPase 1